MRARTSDRIVGAVALLTAVAVFSAGTLPALAGAGDLERGGHGGHGGHAVPADLAPQAPAGPKAAVKVTLADVELVDQDGRRVSFARDVVGGRLVVIDTFYTSCGLVCPLLTALLASVQQSLGERLGRDVVLVSITTDPATDIPARLRDYADRHRARPGWVFLTGSQQSIEQVLRGLGAYTADYTAHPSMILVGDGRHGGWTRFYDFPAPRRLMDRLEELRAHRLAQGR